MSKPESLLYEFGEFQLDAVRRLLLRGGAPVTIAPKVYEVLLALVETPGQPLSKDELLRRVWPDTVVEESNLTVSVSALRKVLGERRGEHQFIATLPGVGYQFVAPVRRTATPPVLLSREQRQRLEKNYTANPEAFQAYLKGRYFWSKRSPAAAKTAIGFFQQAIALNPNYAAVYQYLGLDYIGEGEPALALAAMQRARDLNPLSTIAYTNMGWRSITCAAIPKRSHSSKRRSNSIPT